MDDAKSTIIVVYSNIDHNSIFCSRDQQVVRIGSRQPIEIDVRIVASTNIDLEKAVAAGRFREDLYFRLNVATLRVAPLRERRGDLLPLAQFFLRDYS